MTARPWIQDIISLNRMYFRLFRDVAQVDIGEAMSLFGFDSVTAHRIARMSLEDLEELATVERPLVTVLDNKAFRATVAQREARQPIERVELTRLSAVMQEAAINADAALR